MNNLLTALTMMATAAVLSAATAAPTALQLAWKEESRPTITRAVDVVNDASPKQVNSGEDVVFSVRVGAEGVLRDGFQVRIFTLSSLSATPGEAGQSIDDCLVFFSTVYPIPASDGSRIHLISNASEGWLSLQDGMVGNGYYLLVFERTGVSESVFRIKRSDASAYFATGIRLVVKASNRSRLEEVISRTVTREKLRSMDAAKLVKTDDKIACYRYEKVTRFAGLADAPQQLAMMSCDPKQAGS